MLFRDALCLAVDGANFERVVRIARDFRGCTTTVKVGPTLLLSLGTYAVRGLSELGMHDIVLDLRLFGHYNEVWTAVVEAAKTLRVRALVVQAFCGPEVLAAAVDAAQKTTITSNRRVPPYVIAAGLPFTLTAQTLHALQINAASRQDYVCHVANLCRDAGVDGMVVEYEDIKPVREVCDLPLLCNVRRKVVGYEVALSRDECREPGIREVLRAGADCAVLDMELVGYDAEWCADMAAKDLMRIRRRAK